MRVSAFVDNAEIRPMRLPARNTIHPSPGHHLMSSTDPTAILATLQQLLSERFDIRPETATADALLRDIGLDSMMVLDVIMDIEDRLGVKLDDVGMPRDATLGDVVKVIQRNQGIDV
jgi:acyl carrier protein